MKYLLTFALGVGAGGIFVLLATVALIDKCLTNIDDCEVEF